MIMVSPFASSASRMPRWLFAAGAAVAISAIPLAAVLAQGPSTASFTVAETGRGYASLQAAVDATLNETGIAEEAEEAEGIEGACRGTDTARACSGMPT